MFYDRGTSCGVLELGLWFYLLPHLTSDSQLNMLHGLELGGAGASGAVASRAGLSVLLFRWMRYHTHRSHPFRDLVDV